MYCYFHGLSTFASPGTDCSCNGDLIHDTVLGSYRNSWQVASLNGCKDMDQSISNAENKCAKCSAERNRRQRILRELRNIPPELKKPPYSSAPSLYTFNVPRYYAMQLRAREFAKQDTVQLSWCYAIDFPLHPGDRDLNQEALEAKLFSWLRRHDQQMSHLSCIIPLAVAMSLELSLLR